MKAMPLADFLKIIPSKARRTLSRMGLQVRKFLEKFRDDKKKGKVHKTHFREMVIIPEMLESQVLVYDGKSYVTVMCTPEMLGHKLGEYAITTKLVKHSGPGIGATRGSKTVELK
jgi:small subunit ribosomal protein S19